MAKRRASRVVKRPKSVKRPKPAPKAGDHAAKRPKRAAKTAKTAKKGSLSRKLKEARRRKEIVLEILEQIKSVDKAKPAGMAVAKGGKGKKLAAVPAPVVSAEPHIESAFISRPATPPKRLAPAIESLGPQVAKERVQTGHIQKIKTGVPGLDEMCGGGIEERSIVLVNGDAGSGKTILGLQFLYEGAKNGEAGLFISFGEPRESLYPRMLEFGMDFQELEDKQKFFFVEYQPHEVAKIISEEGGTIYDIITSYGIKRVAVDTITPYMMQFNDAYSARLALVRFFSVFRKFKVTTILLNEWSSHLPLHASAAVAEFLADGIIYLIHSRSADGVQVRGVEIWKMVGADHTEVARPFAFTKKGITIYPNERLFVGHDFKLRR
ncbi:Circadian clock protein kinase KaiC [uncultured archaeon]|nr:Circadian clock protein kinase KaiC [uncultured archaeon]